MQELALESGKKDISWCKRVLVEERDLAAAGSFLARTSLADARVCQSDSHQEGGSTSNTTNATKHSLGSIQGELLMASFDF